MASLATTIPNSSSRLAHLSPNGGYLASVASKTKLTIYKREQLEFIVCAIFTCQDNVDFVQWSPDSELVFTAQLKTAIVQIFSPDQPEFRCKITEGVAGLIHASWAPDSRHLLTYSDFHLHITIWNLESQQSLSITKPKNYQASCFSQCNNFFAVATRQDCKDFINVFNCMTSNEWELQSKFQIPTLDLASILWSRDSGSIIVQESCLRHLILIYSPFGDLISKFSSYQDALGIRTLNFNSTGTFLAIGNFDQSVNILNTLTWQESLNFQHLHPSKLLSSSLITNKLSILKQSDFNEFEYINIYNYNDFNIEYSIVDETKLIPKIGISFLEFSYDGTFLLTKNENIPNILWIWDMNIGTLCCLIQTNDNIKCAQWSPTELLLCYVTGTQLLHFWSPNLGSRTTNAVLSEQQQLISTSSLRFSFIQWSEKADAILAVAPEMSVMIPRSQADNV